MRVCRLRHRYGRKARVRQMPRRAVAGLIVVGSLLGCHPGKPTAHESGETESTATPDAPLQAEGLHNVLRLSDRIYSGSSPAGDEGFRSLRRLGIRTAISVDGARPEVEKARRFGLRYVHLPIGYDGVPRDRALQLARAVRDLPGPVYVHCHHGKHRGPAAAVAAHLCLDARCSVEQAEGFLKQAGTDPRYTGLVGLPRSFRRPSAEELDRADADFPEVAAVPDLARLMVEVDARFDHLQVVQKAGWQQPPDHPDLDPPHEALVLAEQFREAARLDSAGRPAELRLWLSEAESQAMVLEELLRSGKTKGQVDQRVLDAAFSKVRSTCTRCHAKYRDTSR